MGPYRSGMTLGYFSLVLVLKIYVTFCLCVCVRYGLSWNPNMNGHLLSASDDHVWLINY